MGPLLLALLVGTGSRAADVYKGPRPPQPDLPYLMHADNLIPTEVTEAHQQERKGETLYIVTGANSPARTPLAEPIFLFLADKIAPEDLELYRFEVKDGNRQIAISKKHGHPLRLIVTPLGDKLYRVEVNEGLGLPNGEYSLSPQGSNQAFCFEVY